MLVFDGLGGLPRPSDGKTELEHAVCPNLDRLAARGITGLSQPTGWGITPGSGPAHLALFGYDPDEWQIGRGALSALGLGLSLEPGDIAIRVNFCTVDASGRISDRRAGRISNDVNRALVERLNQVRVAGVSVKFVTDQGHRAVLVLRGEGLDVRLRETDPQMTGVLPIAPEALDPAAEHTAKVLAEVLAKGGEALTGKSPANFLLMRGYGMAPTLPSLTDRHGLRAACVAVYPMYRGLAKAAGMTVLDTDDAIDAQFGVVQDSWEDFDFFFVHIKATDTLGEDGNFEGKADVISEVDRCIPSLTALDPDVTVVTGDHSTPAMMRSHSWHPVPFLLCGTNVMYDRTTTFDERSCGGGGLGLFPATSILPMMLAHGDRLKRLEA